MCFRYFDIKDFSIINRLTIPEIELMSEALTLKTVDRQHELHQIAFLINVAGATKKSGNRSVPVYKKFSDFYNYEKELKKVKRKNSEEEAYYKRLEELVQIYKK